MKGKAQQPLEASDSLATTGTDVVPSGQARDHEKTADVMMIDYTNEHTNGRDKIHSRQPTGPRTELGKQRSSRNAIRHGIFSEATLLKGESRPQFEALRAELWQALRPEGGAEELLVDKLASLSWRYRRLLAAEAAEIRKSTEFLDWDQSNQRDEEAELIGRRTFFGDEAGLIWKVQNPEILERCLELLSELRDEIKTTGFQEDRDTSILNKIYGEETTLRETPRDDYRVWFETAEVPEEERAREGYATPEQCKKNALKGIDSEIQRLKIFHKRSASVESERSKIEIVRRNVPEAPALDRLLRYEASLERGFDRTLGQLERLQRLRLGQPVAPRLDVTISG